MRRLLHIGIGLVALLLAAACSRLDDQPVVLEIYLNIPEAEMTKTDPGEVPVETAYESAINNFKFWVFLSGTAGNFSDGHPMAYKQFSETYTGGTQKFTIELEKASARVAESVDVYVLANATSVAMSGLSESSSRNDLDNLVLTGETFGRKSNDGSPSVIAAGTDGLPFSAVGKNLPLTDDYPTLSVSTLQLKRAVSKVQFVFSRSSKSQKTFEITGLQLDGNRIANEECVFNGSDNAYKIVGDADADASYVTEPIILSCPTSINACENPSDYAYSGQGGAAYRTLINTGVSENKLTRGTTCYLRESARPLSGTISYKIDGTAGTAPFSMIPTEIFSRNRSWVVYIYFYDDDIRLSVSWTEWEDGFEKDLTAE